MKPILWHVCHSKFQNQHRIIGLAREVTEQFYKLSGFPIYRFFLRLSLNSLLGQSTRDREEERAG